MTEQKPESAPKAEQKPESAPKAEPKPDEAITVTLKSGTRVTGPARVINKLN